jgi:hypothetical protein
METIPMPLQIIEDNPAFIYKNEERILAAISGLTIFGIQVYEQSYKIKNFEKFKEVFEKVVKGTAIQEEMEPFLMEHLVDQVRTIICFENILKCIVLSRVNLIHMIDKNIFPDLHTRQKKEPIHITEVINQKNQYEKNGRPFFRGLTKQTITVKSLLYEKKYLELIKYPPDVLKILREINEERNQLHMLLHSVISFSFEYAKHEILSRHLENIKRQLKTFSTEDGNRFKVVKIDDVP